MATTKQVSNKVKQRTHYSSSSLQGKMPIGTKLPTSLPSNFKITSIAAVVLNNFWTWDVAQWVECFLSLYKVLGSVLNTNKTGCRGLNPHTLAMYWVWSELSIQELLSKKEKKYCFPKSHSTTAVRRALMLLHASPQTPLLQNPEALINVKHRVLCDLHNSLNPQNSKGGSEHGSVVELVFSAHKPKISFHHKNKNFKKAILGRGGARL